MLGGWRIVQKMNFLRLWHAFINTWTCIALNWKRNVMCCTYQELGFGGKHCYAAVWGDLNSKEVGFALLKHKYPEFSSCHDPFWHLFQIKSAETEYIYIYFLYTGCISSTSLIFDDAELSAKWFTLNGTRDTNNWVILGRKNEKHLIWMLIES